MRYDVEVSGLPLVARRPSLPAAAQGRRLPRHDPDRGMAELGPPGAQVGQVAGRRGRLLALGLGPEDLDRRDPDRRDPAFRRHRRQRIHRRRRSRRGRLHLDRRHARPLGAEHLVSHAQLRIPHPDQRRDRLPLHLRRARRPGPGLRQARRRPARLRPLVPGDQGRPVVRLRRQEPPDRFPGERSGTRRSGQRAEARAHRRL